MQIVLTSRDCDPLIREAIWSWLIQHLPGSEEFEVVGSAKYLGLFIGPTAQMKQWRASLFKWKERAKEIAKTHCAASIASSLYNIRAIPVLGYIGQFTMLPKQFEE